MELLNQFKQYLEAGHGTSQLTIKNYISDVRQFVRWYESSFDASFNPESINSTTLALYYQYRKTELGTSDRSIERHESSLRKFFGFLKTSGAPVQEDQLEPAPQEKPKDEWNLKEFKNFLYNDNSSHLTIKNYILDIRQFLTWTETGLPSQNAWEVEKHNVFDFIHSGLVEEYKSRLLSNNFSPASINRKLSSIRRYFDWRSSYTTQNPITVASLSKASLFDRESFMEKYKNLSHQNQPSRTYSRFPPFRLVQKTGKGIEMLFDATLVIPASKLFSRSLELAWNLKGKPLFSSSTYEKVLDRQISVSNLKKELYAPLSISWQQFPIHKKAFIYIRHKRPKWYERYHKYPAAHYFHLSMLFLFCAGIALYGYNKYVAPHGNSQVLGEVFEETQRSLLFKARLTDTNNVPITVPSDLRLSIYNDEKASGSAMLWEEVLYHVIPNSDGTFTISLGNDKSLPQSIFTSSYQTYLGITVGNNAEMQPRIEIPASHLASDSQQLQGLSPITDINSGTSNVVLALNSSGDLTIGGDAHPTFQATGGEFRLSGQPLTLTTNAGSNADVAIEPDGSGMIDLRKPIHNTSNNNNDLGALGAVEVDDMLSVLATSDATSAFTVNQNGAGKLLSGYNNSIAKFSVDNNGSAFFAGNVGIGTANPLQSLDVNGNIMLSGIAPSIYLGPTNYIGFDTENTILYNTTGDIVVHPATASAFRPFYDDRYALGDASYRWSSLSVGNGTSNFGGKLGIGSSNPDASLQIQRDSGGNAALAIAEQGTGDLFTASSSAGIPFTINNDGQVGIGTATPSSYLTAIAKINNNPIANITNLNTLDSSQNSVLSLRLGTANTGTESRFIQFYADSAGQNDGTLVGSVHINNDGVAYETSGADFAEYFEAGKSLQAGTIVQLNSSKEAVEAINSSDMIGVVSQNGAFIGNLPQNGDISNQVVVGFLGQLPVRVSTDNGPIAVDDSITLGSVPGVGVKALGPGRIIGRALEKLDSGNGTIMVLVQPGWSTNDLADFFGQTISSFKADTAQIGQLFVGKKIISPIADVDIIHTDVISPLDQGGAISLNVEPNQIQITNEKDGSGSAVASIDNQGNATFSGQLTAASASISGSLNSDSLLTNDASISGVLHAGTIIVDNIIGSNLNQAATPSALASSSANLTSVVADTGQFNLGLMALGPSGFTDVTVANQLSLGATLTLSQNSINTLGQTLQIQPLKQGNISFEGDQITFDTNGNLIVNGNAQFAKNVDIEGALSVNIIAPIPGNDLVLNLSNSGNSSSNLVVDNSSGSAVLAINQNGDVNASGSGTFNKLNLNLIEPAYALSNVEQVATGSAGTTAIKPHQMQLTIDNSLVTANSLIYISPIGTPSGQTPFLEQQVPGQSFTVGISQPEFTDTNFNWLIIN